MAMYGQRPRVNEIFEKLRDEVESLVQDASLYKRLSEDYERQRTQGCAYAQSPIARWLTLSLSRAPLSRGSAR